MHACVLFLGSANEMTGGNNYLEKIVMRVPAVEAVFVFVFFLLGCLRLAGDDRNRKKGSLLEAVR